MVEIMGLFFSAVNHPPFIVQIRAEAGRRTLLFIKEKELRELMAVVAHDVISVVGSATAVRIGAVPRTGTPRTKQERECAATAVGFGAIPRSQVC